MLHVVLYHGATRWDAPQSLAELVPTNPEYDRPAQLALSYDVVELVAMAADDLPRPNLITWMAEVERSRRAGGWRAGAGVGTNACSCPMSRDQL